MVYFPKKNLVVKCFKDKGITVNEEKILRRSSQTKLIAVSDDYTFSMVGQQKVLQYLRNTSYIVRTATDINGHCQLALGLFDLKVDAACALWELYPAILLAQEANLSIFTEAVNEPTVDLWGSLFTGKETLVGEISQLF